MAQSRPGARSKVTIWVLLIIWSVGLIFTCSAPRLCGNVMLYMGIALPVIAVIMPSHGLIGFALGAVDVEEPQKRP